MNLTDFLNLEMLPVTAITSDSRKVVKGCLFAALSGTTTNGNGFIDDAIQHGATHILAEEGVSLNELNYDGVTLINVSNSRQAFAKIAAKFYNIQPEHLVAVTGTSGKTSTVSFVQQIWHLSDIKKCASLGTLGVRGPGIQRYGALTTPDTQNLHAELADLAAAGIDHLAMEASSHGLDQYRLDGVQVKAAGYTNLSRDHLDYHNDMDEYFEAKSRLFSEVMPNGSVAVINVDDEYAQKLIQICKKSNHKIITYGQGDATIKLVSHEAKPNGQEIKLAVEGKEYLLTLPLVGEFQIYNALCALGLVLSQDNDADKYIPLLEKLHGVAGRLQFVEGHPKSAIYVDYAHKPAALETILKTLRPHTQGKLVCVFGCGGNRDIGKRSLMGEIANQLADKVIVTDDNPRYEDPAKIRAAIMAVAPNACEIADRAEAIKCAIQELEEGDVLVIAGKGHEQGQIIGEDVLPFDDVEEVKKVISNL